MWAVFIHLGNPALTKLIAIKIVSLFRMHGEVHHPEGVLLTTFFILLSEEVSFLPVAFRL